MAGRSEPPEGEAAERRAQPRPESEEEGPDFARGLRDEPQESDRPDYARGQREHED